MSWVCPRCGKAVDSHDFQCTSCGYRLHVRCFACGKANILNAHFCGNCGASISSTAKLKQSVKRFFSFKAVRTFYNVASGFVFGSLIAFFAFCTMGFSDKSQENSENPQHMCENSFSKFGEKDALNLPAELYEWRSRAGEPTRKACVEDVMNVGRILVESLAAYDFNRNSGLKKADESCISKEETFAERTRYLNSLREVCGGNSSEYVSRSGIAVFFYRIASKYIKLSPDMALEPEYIDVPRYHYLSVPIKMLNLLEISLARDDGTFGGDDNITIAELGRFAAMFLQKTAAFVQNNLSNDSIHRLHRASADPTRPQPLLE